MQPANPGREFESLPARRFGTELGTPKPAVFALEPATSVRRSTLFDPANRRSRSRAARALTVHRWSGSDLPCDHGRTSCRARAPNRYAAMGGAALGRFARYRYSAIKNNVQTFDGTERHRRFYLAVNPRS